MYPFRNSMWHSLVASMLLLSIITAAIAAPMDRERTGSLEAEDSRPVKKPKKSSDDDVAEPRTGGPVIRSYILFMAIPVGKAHWDKEKRELRDIDPKAQLSIGWKQVNGDPKKIEVYRTIRDIAFEFPSYHANFMTDKYNSLI